MPMRDGEVEASMRGHLERVEDIPIKNEYVGRVIPGLPCPDEVLALCAEKEKERLRMVYGPTGFKYPLNGSPIAYIKFGGCVSQGEVRTQRYVFNVFRQMMDASGSGPKVPEVYRSFERGGQCYIVMEFVDGETVKEYLRDSSAETKRWIYDQVANAMRQILEVPVPFGSRPGPVGGGFFYNDLFKCHEAPTEYQSIDRLQRHINKVLKLGGTQHRVDFSDEKLCLCYTDIKEENFMIDKADQLYVIDFGHVAFLPSSFATYAFRSVSKPLAHMIMDKVPVPESSNLQAMYRASYIFVIGSSRVGLKDL